MDEQVAIADHIRLATSEATSLIDRAQREIDLIREYRTRLISDVVTGKIDVRHLVPPPGSEDLEETFEALEPLEDVMADVGIDDEEVVNESD
jgi:type I restriction enzyme S subunit